MVVVVVDVLEVLADDDVGPIDVGAGAETRVVVVTARAEDAVRDDPPHAVAMSEKATTNGTIEREPPIPTTLP